MKTSSIRFLLVNSRIFKQFKNGILIKQFRKKSAHRSNEVDECGYKQTVEMDPTDKIALVTGGTSGIGYGIAVHLLEAGAKCVFITGLDCCKGRDAVYRLNCTFGKEKSVFLQSDINCMIQSEEAYTTILKSYKNIDIVVNNAGYLNDKNWEKEVCINVVGTIRSMLLAYKYVGKEGKGQGGVIVNAGCLNGISPFPATPTHTACQHAILGLSRSFGDRLHVKKSGVRVVHLLSGCTQTDFLTDLDKRGLNPFLGAQIVEVLAKKKKQKPDACGQAVVHLITYASSGSVWVVVASRLFELQIPYWESYKSLQAQYI